MVCRTRQLKKLTSSVTKENNHCNFILATHTHMKVLHCPEAKSTITTMERNNMSRCIYRSRATDNCNNAPRKRSQEAQFRTQLPFVYLKQQNDPKCTV